MGQEASAFFLPGYFLYLASIFYGGAIKLRAVLFKKQVFRSHKLPCPVISIGNLTLGGTGKTPMTIYVAGLVKRLGYRPAVVSRGYKGGSEKRGGIVSDGDNFLLKAEASGDEAFMMARKLKNIPVLVGQNRFRSGMRAIRRCKADVIILDDGFQHLKLQRDIDLVLLDDTRPLGNGYLFPRGILREPVSALKRAHGCVLTRCGKENAHRPELGPGPFFRTCHKPCLEYVVPAGGVSATADAQDRSGLERIRGRRVVAFSGIARNDEFRRMIASLGGDPVAFTGFPDHHWYGPEDFRRLLADIKKTGAGLLITTDKDYARIEGKFAWPVDLVVLGIKISLKDQRKAFDSFIEKKLADIHPAR